MRPLAAALAASWFVIVAPAVHAGATTFDPVKDDRATPPIELLRPDGSPLSLGDLRGKVVLVNFWATWCEPCIAEMPSLQALRQRLGPKDFEVLAVNYQEGPARIQSFVAKTGVTLPIVRDTDGAVARAWNVRVFPSSFLVDRSGRIRYVLVGDADWTGPDLLSTIGALLGPPRR